MKARPPLPASAVAKRSAFSTEPATSSRFADLRLSDLITFLTVYRHQSVTAAARELRVSPSHVSKSMGRLEEQLGFVLLSRGAKGVALSESGRRVLPYVEDLVSRLRRLGHEEISGAAALTLAAPSWLVHLFLPVIANAQPELRVRGLELPPPLLRGYAADNFFDLTLITSDVDRFPGAWVSTRVGEIRKGLFATPALARRLANGVSGPLDPKRVLGVPFVSPIFNLNGQFVLVDDDCPLTHADREIGHEAQTIALALEIAAVTGQLVFGPCIAARRYVESGALVEIDVRGWNVTEPLYVVCNADRVLARVQTGIVKALRAAVGDLATGERDHGASRLDGDSQEGGK